MDAPAPFLIGGPAFSGTTLLTLLLNQGELVCLDEPDFHNPAQAHRGVPVLRERFPGRAFPDPPSAPLDRQATMRFTERCARALLPLRLGVKTCDRVFVELARLHRRAGYPVVAIVRDIRDALVRELPAWVTEESLNESYRLVWRERSSFDLVLRYEDLVDDPDAALQHIASVLGCPLRAPRSWPPASVHPTMRKLDRHDLLERGEISRERVGLWRRAERSLSPRSHETARLMGYPK